MQYTPKIALLALALFGTSAIAAPFAGEAEYDIEAREVDDDLAAREFYESYLEARADPSLDARDVESLDLEAREYLEYLEERAVATATPPQTPTPQTPMSATSASVETHHTTKKHEHIFLTKHQKAERRAKKAAALKFKDPEVYQNALLDKTAKYHRFAVLKYLSKFKHLKKAYENKDSRFHKAALRVVHRKRAKKYLATEENFEKALKNKKSKYHKDAVKLYLSHGNHFENALVHKKSRFHKAAVREYLLDPATRKKVLADKKHAFYKAAKKLEKKINKRKHHKKSASSSVSATSVTATATPTPKA